MLTKNDFLLGITNYNQISEVESYIKKLLPLWDVKHCVVIDDCSTDGSDKIFEQFGFKVIRNPENTGNGAGVRKSALYAKQNGYSALVLNSSNGKMLPEEISVVIEPILKGEADYVTGNRYLKGGSSPGLSLFRQISIPLFSLFYSLLLGKRFSDITCGFRAYKLDFLFGGKMNIEQDWLNRYEMEYYIHYYACKMKLKIKVKFHLYQVS